jgi:hypothetical protein
VRCVLPSIAALLVGIVGLLPGVHSLTGSSPQTYTLTTTQIDRGLCRSPKVPDRLIVTRTNSGKDPDLRNASRLQRDVRNVPRVRRLYHYICGLRRPQPPVPGQPIVCTGNSTPVDFHLAFLEGQHWLLDAIVNWGSCSYINQAHGRAWVAYDWYTFWCLFERTVEIAPERLYPYYRESAPLKSQCVDGKLSSRRIRSDIHLLPQKVSSTSPPPTIPDVIIYAPGWNMVGGRLARTSLQRMHSSRLSRRAMPGRLGAFPEAAADPYPVRYARGVEAERRLFPSYSLGLESRRQPIHGRWHTAFRSNGIPSEW